MSRQTTFPYAALLMVWLLLMGLLGLTLLVAYVRLGEWNTPIHFAIAAVQAGVIALFYMHLAREGNTIRIMSLAGLFWLAIMIALSLNDYMTRPPSGTPWSGQ